jgi:colanic acid biosynthesis protein WcaH
MGTLQHVHLDAQTFRGVVNATPLVSIDLAIRNDLHQVLLGKRSNRPAEGFWFVPGGRIRKNERVAEALLRISTAEIGVAIKEAALLGVFDHIYDDNFAGEPGINTHYVVIAFEHRLPQNCHVSPDAQHSELRWWDVPSLLESPEVHENTKAYFRENMRSAP